MDPILVGLIGIFLLLVLLFMGMQVGMTMLIVGFLGFAYIVNIQGAMGILKTIFYTTGGSYTLTVIPLFVLMGQFAFYSGLSKQLYNACYKWLGFLPGGLGVATVGACSFFAAICGSSTATAATFGSVAIPEMKKYKYDDGLATGAVVAGGTLGILIPPSVGFIVYGIITEQSIGRLFAAGIIPGIFLCLCYMGVVVIQCIKKPELGPPSEHFTWTEKFKALLNVLPVLILFIVVIGGIFIGLFTANEGAAVGAFGSFLYLVWRRQASMKNIMKSLMDTIRTTAMIFLIVIGAYVFGFFLAVSKIPMSLADTISGLDVNKYVILILILILYVFMGALMDSLSMILLTVPIFFPVIMALGFDPIWFGVLMVLMQEMGQITPPVGMNIFVVKGIVGDSVKMSTIIRGVLPHVFAIIVVIFIMVIFPQIPLLLPNLLYK